MRPQPREINLALNKHRIMNEVFRAGSRSRLALAKHLNINPTTAGDYVEELMGMGLLLEGEPATSGRGRSPIPLQLNADFGCFLGLDFEALRARAVLCDFSGEELHRREIAFKPDMGREDILKRIVFLAQNL